MQWPTLEQSLRLAAVAGAVGSFAWGIWVWQDKSNKELAQARFESQRYAETRRIEAAKPFLERQLALFTEATQVAAQIAVDPSSAPAGKLKTRFWQLYWGELALVERGDVEKAMVAFGNALTRGAPAEELRPLSLRIARACRDELAIAWRTDAWSRTGDSGAAFNASGTPEVRR